ncbi:MAG: thioredoxin domain-containing protein [Candidatus Limnocylindrales bacterium]
MSSNDKKSSDGSMSRKERRAAERAARKSGGGTAKSGTTKSTASGRGSGPSIAVISVAAIAIGIVLVVALVLVSGGLGGGEAAAVEEPDTPAPAAELRDGLTLVAQGTTPPVSIEVFEDVQCPHCQTFTERIEPLIIADHVTSGLASLTYHDYIIFGEKSTQAAVAMRAADELGDAFWDYHHTLYYNAEDGDFDRSWLADIAEAVGLDREAFLELLDDEDLAADVAASVSLAASYGVSSTPSVVVNGELIGSPTWEELDAAVKAAAEAAS